MKTELDLSAPAPLHRSEPVPSAGRWVGVPRAFTTRRIPGDWLGRLIAEGTPKAGDLILARVEVLGQHTRLHLPDGRRRQLFEGDEIVVAYGHRYAADQYEAEVPADLGPCHLAAGGGLAGLVVRQHREMRRPTVIQPLGFVGGPFGERPVNVADAALEPVGQPVPGRVPTLAVVGTSMNSGKTTAAACLTRGLTRTGLRVGYVKATGTSAGGDPGLLGDAGAVVTLDCVDAGFTTTYRVPLPAIERACLNLLAHVERAGVDVVVVEIADGLLQQETAALLGTELSRRHFGGVLFAAGDAMGAVMGSGWLAERGHRVVGLTGLLTSAPLQIREADAATGLPVLRTSDLSQRAEALAVLSRMKGAA